MWDLETKEVIHDLGGPAETNSSENSGGHQSTVRDVCVAPDALDVCVYDCICLRLCPHDSCCCIGRCGTCVSRPMP